MNRRVLLEVGFFLEFLGAGLCLWCVSLLIKGNLYIAIAVGLCGIMAYVSLTAICEFLLLEFPVEDPPPGKSRPHNKDASQQCDAFFFVSSSAGVAIHTFVYKCGWSWDEVVYSVRVVGDSRK